jgi:hypothetical protein
MDLLDHVKEHQREKKEAPRMCEFCGKECKNLKSYQSHLVTHKEVKPHKCEVRRCLMIEIYQNFEFLF